MTEDHPRGRVTLAFDTPLNGEQIAALVQQAAQASSERLTAGYDEDTHGSDEQLFSFGQLCYPPEHLRVFTTDSDPWLSRTGSYREIVVASSEWQSGGHQLAEYAASRYHEETEGLVARIMAAYRAAMESGDWPEYIRVPRRLIPPRPPRR